MKNLYKQIILCAFLFLIHSHILTTQASALIINETEPNDSLLAAQNIDGFFSLENNVDILDATIIPWVSITATGDDSFDYFSFNIAQTGSRGIFDIDYGYTDSQFLDTEFFLFDINGLLLAQNDDDFSIPGAEGTTVGFDSFLDYTFNTSGDYVLGVSRFPSGATNNGTIEGSGPDQGTNYSLQVSIENHSLAGQNGGGESNAVPEPATLSLLGSGLLGFLFYRRKP